MQTNRKGDDQRFGLFGSTLHLYDNLVEVVCGEDSHVEYEGDMYVTTTDLSADQVDEQFDALLAGCKDQEQTERDVQDAIQAESNLLDTDWVENQLSRCALLYGGDSPEYLALFDRRKDLLLQREAWVEVVRNAQEGADDEA